MHLLGSAPDHNASNCSGPVCNIVTIRHAQCAEITILWAVEGSIDRNQSWEQNDPTRSGLKSFTIQRFYSVAIDTADWLTE